MQNYSQISVDAYPVLTDGSNKYIRKSHYYGLEILANKAKTKGKDFYLTILSSGHGAGDGNNYYYDTPTDEILRWQMAVGMAFGAKNITHYTSATTAEDYNTMLEPVYQDGVHVGWEKNSDGLFDRIQRINKEFLAWDEIYRNYVWQGYSALDFGETSDSSWGKFRANAMMSLLKNKVTGEEGSYSCDGITNVAITSNSSWTASANNSKDLLIGRFKENNSGNLAFMITNAASAVNEMRNVVSSTKDIYYYNLGYDMVNVDVTLTFESKYVGAWVINKGVKEYIPLVGNKLNLTVDAWNGLFVIPVEEQISLGEITIGKFDSKTSSISWSKVDNAYAYEVVVTRDGKEILKTIVKENQIAIDNVAFGEYTITVTARNDRNYKQSKATKQFTLGLTK